MIHIKRFVKQAITEDNGRGDLFYDIAPDGKLQSTGSQWSINGNR